MDVNHGVWGEYTPKNWSRRLWCKLFPLTFCHVLKFQAVKHRTTFVAVQLSCPLASYHQNVILSDFILSGGGLAFSTYQFPGVSGTRSSLISRSSKGWVGWGTRGKVRGAGTQPINAAKLIGLRTNSSPRPFPLWIGTTSAPLISRPSQPKPSGSPRIPRRFAPPVAEIMLE